MTYLLDTNICIYAIKKRPPQVLRRLRDNLTRGLAISAITLAELELGVEKSAYPAKNRAALLQFLAILEVAPFDDRAAAEYGAICAALHRQGQPIGVMDCLIAAQARALGLVLVSNNLREFRRVPDLALENWAEE